MVAVACEASNAAWMASSFPLLRAAWELAIAMMAARRARTMETAEARMVLVSTVRVENGRVKWFSFE